MTKRQSAWQGMNWIGRQRRLAIYLRDGLACVYCGASIEDGAQLTLDHLRTHVDGGGNESTNLVTCCKTCNSSRGARSVAAFCRAVAEYLGRDPQETLRRVRNSARRVLPTAEARELLARRGSVKRAINKEG